MGTYMGTYIHTVHDSTWVHTWVHTYIHTVHALSYTCIRFCQLLQCKALLYTCSMSLQSQKLNHECSITSTSLSPSLSSLLFHPAGWLHEAVPPSTDSRCRVSPRWPSLPHSVLTRHRLQKVSVYAIHPHPLHNATNLYVCMYVCVCM